MPAMSVVVPIKDECDNILPLYERLSEALSEAEFDGEFIFIDDGSTDGSFARLQAIAARDSRVSVVRFTRNFGQSAAMQAGIDFCHGDVIVTIDADLQNDPADIPKLIQKLGEGYDVVLGQRANRQDSWFWRKLPSSIANFLIRKVTGVPFRDFGCTLRAMRRSIAQELPLYGDMHRFIPALAQQGGARVAQIEVRHHPRQSGHTKYGLMRTFRVLLDLMTVQFLNRFITRPMHLFGGIGLLSLLAGFVSLAATVGMKFSGNVDMTGNPLLLLSVVFALCGVQFLSTGLLGELLARTYFESQDKAPYLVRETINFPAAEPRIHLKQAG